MVKEVYNELLVKFRKAWGNDRNLPKSSPGTSCTPETDTSSSPRGPRLQQFIEETAGGLTEERIAKWWKHDIAILKRVFPRGAVVDLQGLVSTRDQTLSALSEKIWPATIAFSSTSPARRRYRNPRRGRKSTSALKHVRTSVFRGEKTYPVSHLTRRRQIATFLQESIANHGSCNVMVTGYSFRNDSNKNTVINTLTPRKATRKFIIHLLCLENSRKAEILIEEIRFGHCLKDKIQTWVRYYAYDLYNKSLDERLEIFNQKCGSGKCKRAFKRVKVVAKRK